MALEIFVKVRLEMKFFHWIVEKDNIFGSDMSRDPVIVKVNFDIFFTTKLLKNFKLLLQDCF